MLLPVFIMLLGISAKTNQYCTTSVPYYPLATIDSERCSYFDVGYAKYKLCCDTGLLWPVCDLKDYSGVYTKPEVKYYAIADTSQDPPVLTTRCFIPPRERICLWSIKEDRGYGSKKVEPGACERVKGEGGKIWRACCDAGDPKHLWKGPLACNAQDDSGREFYETLGRQTWTQIPIAAHSFDLEHTWTGGIYCYQESLLQVT